MVEADKTIAWQQRTVGQRNVERPRREHEDIDETGEQRGRKNKQRRRLLQALARGGYVRMTEFPLRITTPVYELDGTLEWAGRFDFSSIMLEGTREFTPMYNTVITAILLPDRKR